MNNLSPIVSVGYSISYSSPGRETPFPVTQGGVGDPVAENMYPSGQNLYFSISGNPSTSRPISRKQAVCPLAQSSSLSQLLHIRACMTPDTFFLEYPENLGVSSALHSASCLRDSIQCKVCCRASSAGGLMPSAASRRALRIRLYDNLVEELESEHANTYQAVYVMESLEQV